MRLRSTMLHYRALWPVCLIAIMTGCTSCGGGQGNVTPPVVVPEFNRARAFADLERQCEFGPRAPGSQGHADCLQWLATQLAGADRLVRQNFSALTEFGGPYNFTNLLAVYGEDKPGVPFLLCAHWDTRPVADQDPDPANRDKPILGANDGASGVAVLLEMARAFVASPPPRPVIIALLDAEDSGTSESDMDYMGFCIGSKYLSEHWPEEIAKPAEGVLLDLVGCDNIDNPRLNQPLSGVNSVLDFPQETYSLQHNPALVERVWTLAAQRGHTAFIPTNGGPVIDDHVPLMAGGIRVIDIIDFPPEEWHTVDDTPEHCSADALYQSGDTLLHLLYETP